MSDRNVHANTDFGDGLHDGSGRAVRCGSSDDSSHAAQQSRDARNAGHDWPERGAVSHRLVADRTAAAREILAPAWNQPRYDLGLTPESNRRPPCLSALARFCVRLSSALRRSIETGNVV